MGPLARLRPSRDDSHELPLIGRSVLLVKNTITKYRSICGERKESKSKECQSKENQEKKSRKEIKKRNQSIQSIKSIQKY
jgi:hypothetical protein